AQSMIEVHVAERTLRALLLLPYLGRCNLSGRTVSPLQAKQRGDHNKECCKAKQCRNEQRHHICSLPLLSTRSAASPSSSANSARSSARSRLRSASSAGASAACKR